MYILQRPPGFWHESGLRKPLGNTDKTILPQYCVEMRTKCGTYVRAEHASEVCLLNLVILYPVRFRIRVFDIRIPQE